MFIDNVEISVCSGRGGDGAVSFRREKFVINGGPDGGDGGHGGGVFFIAENNTDTLSFFRAQKKFQAKNGENGGKKNQHGKNGENLTLKIPLGTQIWDTDRGILLHDFKISGERVQILKGGNGGFGNARFKSATNQRPTFAHNGQPGECLHLRLELRLIADIALVGYPNVGKSSIISILSNARPQIADYEFTTLVPNLGVLDLGFESLVMADIPGIIDGASAGRGLGIAFLQHISRCRLLLFVLDFSRKFSPDPKESLKIQLQNLKNELENFSPELSSRPHAIVVNKIDLAPDLSENFLQFLGSSAPKPAFVMQISALTQKNMQNLKIACFDMLKTQ